MNESTDFEKQVQNGERFEFGKNWARFLAHLDDAKVREAQCSLLSLFGLESLAGRSFLDVGCGSGLSSLAAHSGGAGNLFSFDYDPQSVICTETLKARYCPQEKAWQITQGSALDEAFLRSLGKWDIVYSWGVLHHTGQMWRALELITLPVTDRGYLAVAIYNDQGFTSKVWRAIKKAFNRLPPGLRFLVLYPAFLRLWLPTMIRDLLSHGDALRSWHDYPQERGMSAWEDVIDWVGGYPFEVAKPDEVIAFYAARGYTVRNEILRSGLGVNEFLFQKCG